jgi:hypothetical protein
VIIVVAGYARGGVAMPAFPSFTVLSIIKDAKMYFSRSFPHFFPSSPEGGVSTQRATDWIIKRRWRYQGYQGRQGENGKQSNQGKIVYRIGLPPLPLLDTPKDFYIYLAFYE